MRDGIEKRPDIRLAFHAWCTQLWVKERFARTTGTHNCSQGSTWHTRCYAAEYCLPMRSLVNIRGFISSERRYCSFERVWSRINVESEILYSYCGWLHDPEC